MKRLYSLILLGLLLFGCSSPARQKNKPMIVCTTGMIADAVRQLAPSNVEVIALMGPGVDPHLYKATQGDLERLQHADAIVYNGLHLEGKMGEVLERLAEVKPVYAMADGLQNELLIHAPGDSNSYDPHIWFDLSLWSKAAGALRDELGAQFPTWRDSLAKNFMDFEQDLLAAHNRAQNTMRTIPASKRVLVTAHDAFAYFGRAYRLEVRGLQGISTASEFGLRDVTDLVNFITQRKVPAVFVESSVPKKSIEAVMSGCQARGHEVKLGGQLYSDALGEAGSPEETLIGAFKANVEAIYSGLNPQPSTP
jgi:manganese/zinc/iron transport system substrate-binding protein